MPICINCGKHLPDEAEFCFGCGAKVQATTNEKRQTVYEGHIHKCPNCGEIIPSFTAKCPSCNIELRSREISSSLEKFIENINECDERIANNAPDNSKKGWASWSSSKRIWWVILNIFTLCFPLVIYLCLPMIRSGKTPTLTPEEERKASLIGNFPFPNERESILEALMFIKSKMLYISSGEINDKSAYWSRLWSSKGEQLYAKSQTLFKGDEIANSTYKDIKSYEHQISSTIKKRTIAGIAIVVVFIIAMIVIAKTNSSESKEKIVLHDTELGQMLPPLEGKEGEIITDESDHLIVKLYKISSNEFKIYWKDCKNKGFDQGCKEGTSFFEAENDDGYYLQINYSNRTMEIDLAEKK